jgi:ligand-binding SRPBCC domain-containing protein
LEFAIAQVDEGFLLEARMRLACPVQDVFDFFANARNLEALTPPFLRFEVLTAGPIIMRVGTLIDYRLRLRGVPLRWRSEISAWQPPRRFVDRQVRGPYRWWIHEHSFEEQGGATLMTDRVRYGVPGGALVHGLLVAPDLRRIWEYRARRIVELLGG